MTSRLLLTSLLLLLPACAVEMSDINDTADDRSDKQNTSSMAGTYCHKFGNALDDFPFELLELKFDGGSKQRKDTGSATMIGKLFCKKDTPSTPCRRVVVTADYNVSSTTMEFTPTSTAYFDESTEQITEAELRTEPYRIRWQHLEQGTLGLYDRGDASFDHYKPVSTWSDGTCDPGLSDLGI